MKSGRANAGFTLMEVMLAVAILALVISTVYATWSAAMPERTACATTCIAATYQTTRAAVAVFTAARSRG